VGACNDALAAARKKVQTAIDNRNKAAETCAANRVEIDENSPIRDTFWENIWEGLGDILQGIWKVVDAITTWISNNSWWISILATVLTFIPIPFIQAIGLALKIIVVAAELIQTVKKAVVFVSTCIKASRGEATIGDVLITGLDFGIGLASTIGGIAGLAGVGSGVSSLGGDLLKDIGGAAKGWLWDGVPAPFVLEEQQVIPGIKDGLEYLDDQNPQYFDDACPRYFTLPVIPVVPTPIITPVPVITPIPIITPIPVITPVPVFTPAPIPVPIPVPVPPTPPIQVTPIVEPETPIVRPVVA
jgi:hypothetical protein